MSPLLSLRAGSRAKYPWAVGERDALTSINTLAHGIVGEARRALRESRPSNFEPFAAQLGEVAERRLGAQPVDSNGDVAFWCRAVLESIAALDLHGETFDTSLHALAHRAAALGDGMRFGLLYDRRRRIFSIGYRLADAEGPGRLDASFYDLLASEAPPGELRRHRERRCPAAPLVPPGRLVTNVNGRATLMSWGGTSC